MKKRNFTNAFHVLAITLIAITMTVQAYCQYPTANFDAGSYTWVVSTAQNVNYRLPKDIRSGDVITGSVVEEKKGATVQKGASATIKGTVIEIDGKQTTVNKNLFSFIVPAGIAAIPFVIKNAAGDVIKSSSIPVTPSNISIPVRSAAGNGNFFPGNIIQPGQILPVNGSFDGNGANTNFSLNGQPMEVIAETPRTSYAQVPENATPGTATLNIEDNNHKEEHKTNVVMLNLSADKISLLRGEKTVVRVSVSGLDGLAGQGLKLTLENQSPETIAFTKERNNTIIRNIDITNTRSGIYEYSTHIIALSSGVYMISAHLADPIDQDCANAYKECMDKVKADKEAAIKNCNNGDPTAAAKCIADVTAASDKLAQACLDDFLKCVKK